MMNSRLVLFFAVCLSLPVAQAAQPVKKQVARPASATAARPVPRKAAPTVKNNPAVQARRLAMLKDYLGFRIYIRKAYSMPLRYVEWYDIKNLISAFAGKAGFDLIPFWNARNSGGKSEADFALDQVDSLMLGGKFEEAFEVAQKVAQKLKSLEKTRYDSKWQIPYVYHSMGRALYGARRYDDALTVYQWIAPNYPFFRQVLFEKMWAAFKAGRVELALGAIASQRSSYFSKYLTPEAYLIQTYLYKRLCREEDLSQVIAEMKEYEALLTKGDVKDWVSNDANTLTLWHLAQTKPKETDDNRRITPSERQREQNEIKEALNQAYQRQKPKILRDLKTALAYAHLAKVTDTKDVLKPIRQLTSRDELLKQDLEIWPADSSEEWMDEMGKHVLIGDSLCNKPKENTSK
ncbi:MAG: hypothetical protein JST80_08260 [Bdellovibrionales bacterium]|nr:hypothetical protein [Bdellovibrionales bacterium]